MSANARNMLLALAGLVAGCGPVRQLQPTPIELPQACRKVEECRPAAPGSCLVARCHELPEMPIGFCEYFPFTNGDDCK